MMHLQIFLVLFFIVFGIINALSENVSHKDETDARLFLSTFTVILSTVTSTTTIGTTTTCTTSSFAMKACSAVAGRRRRGILYDGDEKLGRLRRGLFYDEDEMEEKDGSINSPIGQSKRSADFTKAAPDSSLTIDTTNLIPLTIQSGFSVPQGVFPGTPRFKLAYGTSTVTTTATSTAIRSLFIFCNSITDYQVCKGTG